MATAESTVAGAEDEIADNQEDVDQAQSDVSAAESELALREAAVEFRESYKNYREVDAAATKAALDQTENNKQNAEGNLRNALNDVSAADQDVKDADTAYQGARAGADTANAAFSNAQSAWQEAVDNLNNGTGSQAQVDAAEAAGIVAAEDAKSKADVLGVAAENKVAKSEILQAKVSTAEAAVQADITAGDQVAQAQSINSFAEADVQSAEAQLQAAEQDRNNAAGDLESKRDALRAAKDALKQSRKDASGPKGVKDRAEFDRDQAQQQLVACELSPVCDGGDADAPPPVNCTAEQEAVDNAAAQLATAEAMYQAAKGVAETASDSATDATIALSLAQANYSGANVAYTFFSAHLKTHFFEFSVAGNFRSIWVYPGYATGSGGFFEAWLRCPKVRGIAAPGPFA